MSILPAVQLQPKGSTCSSPLCPNSSAPNAKGDGDGDPVPIPDSASASASQPQLMPMSPALSGSSVSAAADLSPEQEVNTLTAGETLPNQNVNANSQTWSAGGKFQPNRVYPRNQHTVGFANPHGAGGRRVHLTNGNHLLNFHYDPISRPQPHQQRQPPPRRHHKIKPYNKDLFLQANYKFVVLDSGQYTPESMDPDKMLRWEDIICVRFSSPSSVHCPICLESPLCPQITSCGHVFCFPCILQYLLMGKEDEKGDCWKRCPLCFVMISPKDLYTIFIEYVREYNVGDKVEFLLLTRQKDSNTLSHNNKNKKEKDANADCAAESYDPFSKFTFTLDVDLSVRKAIADLDSWLAKADSGLVDDIEKLPYVCAAMEHLEQRKKYWDEHRVCHSNEPSKDSDRSTCSYIIQTNAKATHSNSEVSDFGIQNVPRKVDDQNKNKWLSYSGRDNLDVQTCSAAAVESLDSQEYIFSSSYDETRGLHGNTKGSIDVREKDFYNFYQAADGQHIILHPLNMKCLLHHFGSQDLLPDRIRGKILQLETVTQSEAIRRRFRFLSHFSLTTTFQLCEIDLSESLPPDALLPFMDEIKKREKQRKQVARKERKEKIKAEAAIEGPMSTFSSFQHSFRGGSPAFSMDDFEALGTSSAQSSSPPVVGGRKLFSSVTKLGFAAGHDSPALKIEENNNQGKGDSSGVTGPSNAGTASFAKVISSRGKAVETPKMNEGKKGKKPSRVLLSTAGGRRY